MLSWSAIDPGILGDSSHGKFGYNVYKDGVLIAWTDKTTYTFKPDSVFGTYKVIGTYKSYNDLQSEAAVAVYKKVEPTPTPTPTPPPETPTPTQTPTPTEAPTPTPPAQNNTP